MIASAASIANPTCSISGDGAACAGTTGHTYTGPANMSTYTWSLSGNGTINGASNGQSVTVDAGAAGSFTLHLVIANANGCSSSCNKTVTVNPNPPCSIAVEFCGPEGDALSYLWSGPDSFVVTNRCTGPLSTPGTYKLTVTETNGCTSTCQRDLSP